MCRGKEVSRAKVILVSFIDNRANTSRKVLAQDRLVSVGILAHVISIKTNRDAKQGTSVCSRIIRLTNNRTKKPKICQGDGVPKAWLQHAVGDSRGSRTCVCANTQGKEGRINVLPWYRLVGVVRRKEEEPGCPHGQVVATWYGDDSPHLLWNAPR